MSFGFRFRFLGAGFRVQRQGLGIQVKGLRFGVMVKCSESRTSGCGVEGLGFKVSGFGFRVMVYRSGLIFMFLGSGLWGLGDKVEDVFYFCFGLQGCTSGLMFCV